MLVCETTSSTSIAYFFSLTKSRCGMPAPRLRTRVCGVTSSVVPQGYRLESVRLSRRGATPFATDRGRRIFRHHDWTGPFIRWHFSCELCSPTNVPHFFAGLHGTLRPGIVSFHSQWSFPSSAVFPAATTQYLALTLSDPLGPVVPHRRCDLPALITGCIKRVAYNPQPELHWRRRSGQPFTGRPICVKEAHGKQCLEPAEGFDPPTC